MTVHNFVSTDEKAPAEAGAIEEPETLVAHRAEAEGLEPPSAFARRISRANQPTTGEPAPTPDDPDTRPGEPSIRSVRDGATPADPAQPVTNPVSSLPRYRVRWRDADELVIEELSEFRPGEYSAIDSFDDVEELEEWWRDWEEIVRGEREAIDAFLRAEADHA